jgi:phosphoglycolate phosphatase/putative hydrolase of the HAD superfamily
MGKVEWERVKAVIFDVDGTLYDQSQLRKKMLFELLRYYLMRPWRFREMLALAHFRSEREKRAGFPGPDLENAQYTWCTERGRYPAAMVRNVVGRWIFKRPLRYLNACTYPGTKDFFEALRRQGIPIAIYSDYVAHEKLKAMGLAADIVVSSTDPEVDRLKPDPKGLLYIADQLGVTPSECLFIGDRQEMDGACALNAHMPYLIIEKKPYKIFDFYTKLTEQLTFTLKPEEHGTQFLAS